MGSASGASNVARASNLSSLSSAGIIRAGEYADWLAVGVVALAVVGLAVVLAIALRTVATLAHYGWHAYLRHRTYRLNVARARRRALLLERVRHRAYS